MTNPCPDLKAAMLGEASADERRQVEQHLKACAPCQEEWSRLEVTFAVLRSAPDEEMPRRIAFVSDKVFEPRWWQRLFRAPAIGFASAAMLSAAILTHAVYPRPVVPVAQAQPSPVSPAAVTQVEVESTVRDAVKQAVAEVEARHRKETAQLVSAVEKRYEERLAETRAMMEVSFEMLAKKMANVKRASYASAELEANR
ncbi:MAG: zf-HC2 domain-containing protein [Bryobacteraceae bacterium]